MTKKEISGEEVNGISGEWPFGDVSLHLFENMGNYDPFNCRANTVSQLGITNKWIVITFLILIDLFDCFSSCPCWKK